MAEERRPPVRARPDEMRGRVTRGAGTFRPHALTLPRVDGVVLAENRPMLALMTSLGFRVDRDEDDTSLRRVWLDLSPRAGDAIES